MVWWKVTASLGKSTASIFRVEEHMESQPRRQQFFLATMLRTSNLECESCKYYIFSRVQCSKRVKIDLMLQNIIVNLIMGLNKILFLNSVIIPQAVFIMCVTIVIESSNGNLF